KRWPGEGRRARVSAEEKPARTVRPVGEGQGVQRALSRRFFSLASAGDVCFAKPNHAAVGWQQHTRLTTTKGQQKTSAVLVARVRLRRGNGGGSSWFCLRRRRLSARMRRPPSARGAGRHRRL